MKKTLNSYRGKLTPAQAAAGMNAAVSNARRLVEDAEILLKAGRAPTAASLAILSIEEAGKASILRSVVLARSDAERAAAWKDYRSHTRKNVTWMLPELVAGGARSLEDFRPLFCESSEHPFALDQVKQLGLYTDCLGNAHWSVPSEIVDAQLAAMLVRIARILAMQQEHSEREVELWMEHMGPVWKKDMRSMKRALVGWFAAMREAGLTTHSENSMEEFIHRANSRGE